MLSIVITTYQRANVVCAAVESALAVIAIAGGEVIVVDDASTDGTSALIRARFQGAIEDKTLSLIDMAANVGVTGAKNAGFAAARGAWVIFLDSDDVLLTDAAEDMVQTLRDHNERALIFFRCVDEKGFFVGKRFEVNCDLSLRTYLRWTSYGEALVAVNKAIVPRPPYDIDLRGYEGIGCARIIRDHGPALLSTVVARCYDRSNGDRLSSLEGFLGRSTLVGRGHLRFAHEFWRDCTPRHLVMLTIKAGLYMTAGLVFGVWRVARG